MQPLPLSHYARELYHLVPKAAAKAATYKLWFMALHAAHVFGQLYLVCFIDTLLYAFLGAALAGVSIACLFLYCHELSHGTIIRRQPYYYLTELFFWSFSGIPPTVWKRVHNDSHHKHMNTYDDPDSKTFKSEANFWSRLYNVFIYPNKRLRYSLTVGFAMLFYSTKHTLAVFYRRGSKPGIVTHRPNYSRKEIRRVALEFLFILLFWTSIIWLAGPYAVIFCLVSWITYSALVISIIITQHLRDPAFVDIADPLLTSTSIVLPAWLDRLIDWHSFHVEHHLFPGINFDYYPSISEGIQQAYPDRYERLPLLQAIKEAYDQDVFIDDPLT